MMMIRRGGKERGRQNSAKLQSGPPRTEKFEACLTTMCVCQLMRRRVTRLARKEASTLLAHTDNTARATYLTHLPLSPFLPCPFPRPSASRALFLARTMATVNRISEPLALPRGAPLRVKNSLSKEKACQIYDVILTGKEIFEPANLKEVTWYSCGPSITCSSRGK